MGPLSRAISHLHIAVFRRKHTHPYLLMFDLGVGTALLAGYAQAEALGLSGRLYIVAMALVIGYYRKYLALKQRLVGAGARNFLHDCMLYCYPVFALTMASTGSAPSSTTSLFLFSFMIILSMARLGCLVGGCCYGKRSRWGLLYPAIVFDNRPTCRAFRPGPDPGEPVLPIQLLEAIVGGGLALYLWLHAAEFSGEGMWRLNLIVVNIYIGFRFVLEFARDDRPSELIRGLSQTQWIAFLLTLAQGLVFSAYAPAA